MFNNNCAHAVRSVLHFAGCIKDGPEKKWGLRPSQVALEACKIALKGVAEERNQILMTKQGNVKILLLENSIKRLKLKQKQKIIRSIPFTGRKLAKEIKQLEALRNEALRNSCDQNLLSKLEPMLKSIGGKTGIELREIHQHLISNNKTTSYKDIKEHKKEFPILKKVLNIFKLFKNPPTTVKVKAGKAATNLKRRLKSLYNKEITRKI